MHNKIDHFEVRVKSVNIAVQPPPTSIALSSSQMETPYLMNNNSLFRPPSSLWQPPGYFLSAISFLFFFSTSIYETVEKLWDYFLIPLWR